MAIIEPLKITVNDSQPYYYAQAKDRAGTVIDITSASIVCTMRTVDEVTTKINRQSTGITITDATNGKFRYAWQSGDTDTVEIYYIEFEITPASGGKYTLPMPFEGRAEVHVVSSQDTT